MFKINYRGNFDVVTHYRFKQFLTKYLICLPLFCKIIVNTAILVGL